MLKLRLARVGKRGHATFRVVVTEHTRPPKSGSLEQLGSYDPHANALRVDAERVKTHLAHGAQLSPTLRNLLIENKVIEGQKVVAWKPKKKSTAAVGSPTSASASAETSGQEAVGAQPSTTSGSATPAPSSDVGGKTSDVGAGAGEAPPPPKEQPAG